MPAINGLTRMAREMKSSFPVGIDRTQYGFPICRALFNGYTRQTPHPAGIDCEAGNWLRELRLLDFNDLHLSERGRLKAREKKTANRWFIGKRRYA